jgi:hypothetical protein
MELGQACSTRSSEAIRGSQSAVQNDKLNFKNFPGTAEIERRCNFENLKALYL